MTTKINERVNKPMGSIRLLLIPLVIIMIFCFSYEAATAPKQPASVASSNSTRKVKAVTPASDKLNVAQNQSLPTITPKKDCGCNDANQSVAGSIQTMSPQQATGPNGNTPHPAPQKVDKPDLSILDRPIDKVLSIPQNATNLLR